MSALIKTLLFVVVAEMGDKSQLLAMTLASKYKAKQVIMGVFIATVLNHSIAVAFGGFLCNAIPFEYIKITAAISFIVFGLWTIKGDSAEEEKEKKLKLGPVAAIAATFFISEFGDKTQLMTVTLSAEYNEPIFVLVGAIVGMLIADGIGILGGAWLSKHVPGIYIKWTAAAIFMIFGVINLYETLPTYCLAPIYVIPFFILLIALVCLIVYSGRKGKRNDIEKDLQEQD